MDKKRGQVTIFILLMFVVLIAFSLLTYVRVIKIEKIVAETEKTASDLSFAEPVKNYIQSCLDDVSENSVGVIGIQGGYYEQPEYSFQDFLFFYSYHFVGNQNIMPPKSKVEEEIAKSVKENLPLCFLNFSVFEEQGFKIGYGPISTASTITEKEIVIDLVYPINIKKESQSTLIANFKSIVPVRLKTVYETAEFINNMQVLDPNNLCLTCIIEKANENNLSLKSFSYEDGDILFEIIDNESILRNESYSFIFVAKHEN